MLNTSIRTQFGLIILFALTVVTAAAIYLFSNSWLDLSRAYGLLSLKKTLDTYDFRDAATTKTKFSADEFGLAVNMANKNETRWIKPPGDIFTPELLAEAAHSLATDVLATQLNEGSFERSLLMGTDVGGQYFVAFRAVGNIMIIMGTTANRSLWQLSIWASPFLGVLAVTFFLSIVFTYYASSRLTHAYRDIGKALENVGNGELALVSLPQYFDPDLRQLSDALKNMVTLIKNRNAEIAKVTDQAEHDQKTGLPNNRGFATYMKNFYTEFAKAPGSYSVLAIIDLDHFKKVNDTHGHIVGDLVLKETAKAIMSSIRRENGTGRYPDFCCRFGGEEFVIIFNRCVADGVHVGPMRVLNAIRNTVVHVPQDLSANKKAYDLKVTASIGMASIHKDSMFASTNEWVKAADEALYKAKKNGRSRLVSYNPEKQWT